MRAGRRAPLLRLPPIADRGDNRPSLLSEVGAPEAARLPGRFLLPFGSDDHERRIVIGTGQETPFGRASILLSSVIAAVVGALNRRRHGGGIATRTAFAVDATLATPNGLAFAGDGSVYIADYGNNRIRRMSAGGAITTVVGLGRGAFAGDGGPATAAELRGPAAVAIGRDGTLYIADYGNSRVRRVRPDGVISTVAGDGQIGSSGDGGPATAVAGQDYSGFSGDGGPATVAQLSGPSGVAVANDGSLYIADCPNERVRHVSKDGAITTVAGVGESDFRGDDGPATAAALHDPDSVAVAADGSLYIVDTGNNRVRQVGNGGVITTVAGDGQSGFSGDNGPSAAAELSDPTDVAIASDGTLYIADAGNNRVRRVSPAGIITTVAGNGEVGVYGDGGPAGGAQLNRPTGVAIAGDGNLYIADSGNALIRRVSPKGVITIVAGVGQHGFGGDEGPATAAWLDEPARVAIGGDGSLYIADSNNNRVRRVSPAGVITTVAGSSGVV